MDTPCPFSGNSGNESDVVRAKKEAQEKKNTHKPKRQTVLRKEGTLDKEEEDNVSGKASSGGGTNQPDDKNSTNEVD